MLAQLKCSSKMADEAGRGGMELVVFFTLAFAFAFSLPRFRRVKCNASANSSARKLVHFLRGTCACICIMVVHTCIFLRLHLHLCLHLRLMCEPGLSVILTPQRPPFR